MGQQGHLAVSVSSSEPASHRSVSALDFHRHDLKYGHRKEVGPIRFPSGDPDVAAAAAVTFGRV